jgi:hypothetical protein
MQWTPGGLSLERLVGTH